MLTLARKRKRAEVGGYTLYVRIPQALGDWLKEQAVAEGRVQGLIVEDALGLYRARAARRARAAGPQAGSAEGAQARPDDRPGGHGGNEGTASPEGGER